MNFTQQLLTTLGTAGVSSIVLTWLLSTLLSNRIAASIKHEYDEKLEQFRAEVALENGKILEQIKTENSKHLEEYRVQLNLGVAENKDAREADRALYRQFLIDLPRDSNRDSSELNATMARHSRPPRTKRVGSFALGGGRQVFDHKLRSPHVAAVADGVGERGDGGFGQGGELAVAYRHDLVSASRRRWRGNHRPPSASG
jgi:hypothetical protein